jgi:C1A family cysteine protease
MDSGFTMAVNKFSDMTTAEFKQRLGYKPSTTSLEAEDYTILDETTAPASVDWRTKKAVTPVKDQQQCGSCWAFSATGSIEGAYAIKNNKLVSFSEQQLVDCSTSEGNEGCNGGLMDAAFTYAESHSLETEADYPYTANDGTCHAVAKKGIVKLTGHKDVKPNTPAQLEAAVALGPVSVAIEADTSVFQSYSKGIISSAACGTQLDHGVLVVGYGTEGGKPYWILKNSWGNSWGEKGFFRIAKSTKSDAGICGLQSEPSYPTV